ncbi:hypothetical protein [Streptomyces sp. A012304]|uniref:hypothetical protein n=1 Tax=Streptomyces sp. A012304 TaxID=375446 RepID=UPI0022316659|nr:hypothetical protein [Streptomyces sp. A012304]GKQ37948.1 hypothetical protein ALMP_44830 [Streptomyces sp. A012304]
MDITHTLKEFLGAMADDSKKAFDGLLSRPAQDGVLPGGAGTALSSTRSALLAQLCALPGPDTGPPASAPRAGDLTAIAESLSTLACLLHRLDEVTDQLGELLHRLPPLLDVPDVSAAAGETVTAATHTASEAAGSVTATAAATAPQAVSATVRKLPPLGW